MESSYLPALAGLDGQDGLPVAAAAEFAQTMPALLVSLLERRYLSGP